MSRISRISNIGKMSYLVKIGEMSEMIQISHISNIGKMSYFCEIGGFLLPLFHDLEVTRAGFWRLEVDVEVNNC